mgnify:CR=1 FL=1
MKSPIQQALKLFIPLLVFATFNIALAEDVRYEQEIKDLAYGVALFDFYQDDNLAAITAIESAMQRNQINNQPESAELLLGGLYYEYGLENDAEAIFNKLQGKLLDTEIQNRVWFSLAQLNYANNNFADAQDLLSRIEQKLSPQREAQKQYMLSNIYLQQQKLDLAKIAALNIPENNIWRAYCRYNIGVSLLAANDYKQAEEWLTPLIEQEIEDHEIFALQDAANLALGMNAIKRQQPASAVSYFTQIQLSSNLSNKALLGTGWAWSQQDQPEKALAYWQALQRRAQSDIASQEVLMAIAQGIEQMQNKTLAIQVYEDASNRYDQILQDMNLAIEGIQKGVLMNTLSSKMVVTDSTFNILDETLSKIPSTPYLQPLFASEYFQKSLQHYQELLTIQSTLGDWQKNLPALTLMLKERKMVFEQKRPSVDESTNLEYLTSLQQKRDALAISVLTLEQNEHSLALANDTEKEHLEQLMSVKALLRQLQNTRDLSEEKAKYRLLSGVLIWQISTDFPRRFYRIKNELSQLNTALEQAGLAAQSLTAAAIRNEKDLKLFAQSIQGQDEMIQRLKNRVDILIEQQQQQINAQAIEAIELRKQKLEKFRIRARYSLALLKDEMTRKQDQ